MHMTQRDALIMKKYLLALEKIIFKDRNCSYVIEVEKISLKLGNKIGKNAEYYSRWCTDDEKLYFTHQTINFQKRNFFEWNWGEKKFL